MPAYFGIGQHTKSIVKQKVSQIIIMRAYFCATANLQAFGSKRFHFTIELKISLSVRFGPDLLISFGSTVRNWNCDNPMGHPL